MIQTALALTFYFQLTFQVIILLLLCSLYFYLYKKFKNHQQNNPNSFWDDALMRVARFWQVLSYIWHGYEIEGLENLPMDKPVLIIFYHAAATLDIIFAISNIFLITNRKVKSVIDRSTFKIPGIQSWIEATGGMPGSIETCVDVLKNNDILAIAPGGTREMMLSYNYNLIWANRKGFAKVAIEAKVPIVLLFTKNCRQITKNVRILPFKLVEYLYEKYNFMLMPLIGWFPVKLKTYISKPIEYDEARSVDELVELVKCEMEKLIKEKQNIPGSIFYSILERFRKSD